MSSSYLDIDSDIVALASARGHGAIALVRIAGPSSIRRLSAIFSKPKSLLKLNGYQAVHGEVLGQDKSPADEVVALVFKAPNSYTGQDGADIMCHGGSATIEAVLSALDFGGFRPALPGEFTFRAFYNGKMDLARAEAVNELIVARTSAARADAYARLSGALSKELSVLKEGLVDTAATLALGMDYGEEEAGEDMKAELELLEKTRSACLKLASSYKVGKAFKDGVMVALAGKTNAGKSSIFNRLLKEERAIVSPVAGTTRDYIEAALDLGGIPVSIVDTAGVRESEDQVEAEGVRRSWLLADSADIVLYVVDAGLGLDAGDKEFLAAHPDAIKVWNKVDKEGARKAPGSWLEFSAKQGYGEETLVNAIQSAALGGGQAALLSGREVRIGSARHKAALEKAAASLESAIALLNSGGPLDMAAVDLAAALDALAEISGEVSSEDILDRLFSSFCVGK